MEGKPFNERLKELLTFFNRTGRVFFGLKNTKELTAKNYKGFIIVASDTSDRVNREAFFFLKKGYNVYKIPITKKELGNWFGKNEVGVIFLPNNSLSLKIEKLLQKNKKNLPTLSWKINREGSNLATKRIRRTIKYRLQRTSENIKRKFRTKRKGKYKSNG